MKQPFRFVGTECEIGRVRLDRFGQRVELDADFAPVALRGGAALLTEQQFGSIGFSEEDLKVWANPFMDLNEVPADPEEAKRKAVFIGRRRMAQQIYCEVRDGLIAAAKAGMTPNSVMEETPGEE